MNYYERLRHLREDHDLKQQQIAEILGTTQEQYWKYENGKQMMSIDRYITLAKYYNVSMDYLTGIIDTPRTLDGSPYTKNYTIADHLKNLTVITIEERKNEQTKKH